MGSSQREDQTIWPTWMWANEEVVELAKWLCKHIDDQPEDKKVGFYGLDVYSLCEKNSPFA